MFELESLQKSYQKKILKLQGNILELLIGLILLWFCVHYLGSHPAEKTSIVSWAQMMYQKIEIFVWNIFYGDGDLRKEQNDLIRTYSDIISQITDMKCEGMVSKNLIEQKFIQLKALSLKEFAMMQDSYKMFISGQYLKIKELCGNK